MMRSLVLEVSEAARFDSAGRAQVRLGPVPQFERWTITRLTVTSDGGSPVFACYRGPSAVAGAFIDNTRNTVDTTDCNESLLPGGVLLGVWEGGLPGAVGTLNANGVRTVR